MRIRFVYRFPREACFFVFRNIQFIMKFYKSFKFYSFNSAFQKLFFSFSTRIVFTFSNGYKIHKIRIRFVYCFHAKRVFYFNKPLFYSKFLFSDLFLHWRITTEAMGIWRSAGAFAVVERQGECGSKDC